MESEKNKRKQATDRLVAALLGAPPTYDDLRRHVATLEEFICWLSVASDRERRMALKPYKPKSVIKKGGRPKVRSAESNAQLAEAVDGLKKHYGYTSRSQTIRRVLGDGYVARGLRRARIDTLEVKAEIKTLLNRMPPVKPKRKISQKPIKGISGKK